MSVFLVAGMEIEHKDITIEKETQQEFYAHIKYCIKIPKLN